jgi:hypothetical protein
MPAASSTTVVVVKSLGVAGLFGVTVKGAEWMLMGITDINIVNILLDRGVAIAGFVFFLYWLLERNKESREDALAAKKEAREDIEAERTHAHAERMETIAADRSSEEQRNIERQKRDEQQHIQIVELRAKVDSLWEVILGLAKEGRLSVADIVSEMSDKQKENILRDHDSKGTAK